MPKVVEILLDITLVAVIMSLLIVICSAVMAQGGVVDQGFNTIIDKIFLNIQNQLNLI